MMDNDAIETFFRQHYAQAYGLAFSLLHDEEASRDVVADAFEQMMNLNHNDTEQKLTPCFVERKKYSEAAREMGISKNTVKKHIINGLRFLRMRFAPDE